MAEFQIITQKFFRANFENEHAPGTTHYNTLWPCLPTYKGNFRQKK
jgi:hypothetical protein